MKRIASVLFVLFALTALPSAADEWVSRDGGKCLNMSGGMFADPQSYDDRHPLIAWPCSGAANEDFVVTGGDHSRLMLRNSNWCVSTSDNNRNQGDPLILTKCLFGADGDFWQNVALSDDGVLHQNSGWCLNIEGGLVGQFFGALTGNQAQRIILWSCDGGNNEKWKTGQIANLKSLSNGSLFAIPGVKGIFGLYNGAVYPANDGNINVTDSSGNPIPPLGVVSHDSGTIVASGAGNLVATGGGNVVATGGGNVIASGAGNLISSDSAGILNLNGGSFIGTDAGNGTLLSFTNQMNGAGLAQQIANNTANANYFRQDSQITAFSNISTARQFPLSFDSQNIANVMKACGATPATPVDQVRIAFVVGSANKYAKLNDVPKDKIPALAKAHILHGLVCIDDARANSWTEYKGPWDVPATAPAPAPPAPPTTAVATPPPPVPSNPVTPAPAPVPPSAAVPAQTTVHDLAPGNGNALRITLSTGETWHFDFKDARAANRGGGVYDVTFSNAPGFTLSNGLTTNRGTVAEVQVQGNQTHDPANMKYFLNAILANLPSTPFPTTTAAATPPSQPAPAPVSNVTKSIATPPPQSAPAAPAVAPKPSAAPAPASAPAPSVTKSVAGAPVPAAPAAPKPSPAITNMHDLAPGNPSAFTIVLSNGEAWHFAIANVHAKGAGAGRYAVTFDNAPGFTLTETGSELTTDRGKVVEVRLGAMASSEATAMQAIVRKVMTSATSEPAAAAPVVAAAPPKPAATPKPVPPPPPPLFDARAIEGRFTTPPMYLLQRNGAVAFPSTQKSDLPLIAFPEAFQPNRMHHGDKNPVCGKVVIMLDGKRYAEKVPQSALPQVLGFACENNVIAAGGWRRETF